MVYHLIVAVLGIALLFCGWVWVQRRAAREKCEGLIDEAACVLCPGCHGCRRAVGAMDREKNRRPSFGKRSAAI